MSEAITTGTKFDSGKPRVGLIDTLFIFAVAKVLTFGAKKYAAHNWRGGLEVSRIMDAVLRHIFSFMDGEDTDPESGEPHLAHAACGLMFALRMLKDRPDLDDRYKKPEPTFGERMEALGYPEVNGYSDPFSNTKDF